VVIETVLSGSDGKESHLHKLLVQRHFSKQSEAYTSSSLLSDQDNLDIIVHLADIVGDDRVLDVATGTGFLAATLSRIAREVIATDITTRMLEETKTRIENRSNVKFAKADAEYLPFANCCFDAVSCRIAFHHFPYPQAALSEMARVCKSGGRVVIVDVVSSEDGAKSEYHNQMERLFDDSHVKAYKQIELKEMMCASSLKVTKVQLCPFAYSFDEWRRVAGVDATTAEKVRLMMLDSMDGDQAGLCVEFHEGNLRFIYNIAILVGQKVNDDEGKYVRVTG